MYEGKKVSNVYQHQFFIVLNFSPLLQLYNERVYNVYFVTTAKKTQQKALYVYYIRGVYSTIYDTHTTDKCMYVKRMKISI